MILLSVDHMREMYDAQAPKLFKKYGGGDWPSIIFKNSFESAMHFGDFGYGIVVVDAEGIVRDINPYDIEASLKKVFSEE